jgi:heme-degrading monooxygenase HmoA
LPRSRASSKKRPTEWEATMILEHALLTIKHGREAAFEQTMRAAVALISATPGFIALSVRPCVEKPNIYLLLVQWETVEAHEIGFRKSDRYAEWAKLLHDFYNPFPEVLHFGSVIAQG